MTDVMMALPASLLLVGSLLLTVACVVIAHRDRRRWERAERRARLAESASRVPTIAELLARDLRAYEIEHRREF